MSRIGRVPIPVPSGVQCQLLGDKLIINGQKGTMEAYISTHFSVEIQESSLKVNLVDLSKSMPKKVSMLYGTTCRLILNGVLGVSKGFQKKLELVGVGYKGEVQGGKVLKLNLGYSHDILYSIPEGITITMEKPTLFTISGVDKAVVGQTAAEIIRFRPPEPYKGKGVRVPGQYLRMKEGKSKK